MIFLIYTSRATNPLEFEDLRVLLHSARRHNKEKGITGVLLYQGNSFIQFLEGPRDAVLPLYERIKQDTRHHNVQLHLAAPIHERMFAEWSMGFPGDEDALNDEGRSVYTAIERTHHLSKRLLLSFRDNLDPTFTVHRPIKLAPQSKAKAA